MSLAGALSVAMASSLQQGDGEHAEVVGIDLALGTAILQHQTGR